MQPLDASPLRRTHALEAGPRVHLRLARAGDHTAVRVLLEGRGVEASDLTIRRALAFDPLDRVVLCAFAPIGGAETLVGLGAIDLRPDAEPDTIVVDERLTRGLGELLGAVLRERAAQRFRAA